MFLIFPNLIPMKISVILIIFLCFHNPVAQEIYTSPFSEHFPSGIVETFERRIIIKEDNIIIETAIDDSTVDVQTLLIASYELSKNDFENYRIYLCTSQDGKFPYKVIIPKGAEYILIYQPSRLIPGEMEAYRLLMD